MRKLVSIVTPCYNEEENVEELAARIAKVMAALPYDYEHICIDNRSTDGTVGKLREIAGRDQERDPVMPPLRGPPDPRSRQPSCRPPPPLCHPPPPAW